MCVDLYDVAVVLEELVEGVLEVGELDSLVQVLQVEGGVLGGLGHRRAEAGRCVKHRCIH